MCTSDSIRDSSQTLVNDRWCINPIIHTIRLSKHCMSFVIYKEKNE